MPGYRGSGGVLGKGSGTANRLARWTDANTLGVSLLSDDATNVTLVSGQLLIPSGSVTIPGWAFSAEVGLGVYRRAAGFQTLTGSLGFQSTATIGWQPDSTSAADVVLARDQADVMAQRRGTNGQTYRLYGTFTDASNFERLLFNHDGVSGWVRTGNAGTGSARPLSFSADDGTTYWRINTVNALIVSPDNAHDIGASGATRPRDLYMGRDILPNTTVSKLGGASNLWAQLYMDFTNTLTVGAVTINKPTGRVRIAASGTSVVVTNSLVTAASHVSAWMSNADTTGRVTSVVPAAGSFTINTVAVTAEATFDFMVFNAD